MTQDQRSRNLRRRYGLSVEQYEALLDHQGGRCAVCGVQECVSGRRFAVDHDHESLEIRGLLCLNCNSLIGKLEKSPEGPQVTAANVFTYLQSPPTHILWPDAVPRTPK